MLLLNFFFLISENNENQKWNSLIKFNLQWNSKENREIIVDHELLKFLLETDHHLIIQLFLDFREKLKSQKIKFFG